MTLVVNLYGPPGSGKSTVAAGVFTRLKQQGLNCELVTEYAKDLTWEQRKTALSFQPYVIGKQMYRIYRLLDQVDVVITDSPILLSDIYQSEFLREETHWSQFVEDIHNSWQTLDILLKSDLPYSESGRNQTEAEAKQIGREIEELLQAHNVVYVESKVVHGDATIRDIAAYVQAYLEQLYPPLQTKEANKRNSNDGLIKISLPRSVKNAV